jgi:hypothetical protein
VDREKLQFHLRERCGCCTSTSGKNVVDTPHRWAESLVAMTSGYGFTDVRRLTTLFRKACSRADENCQNLVVIGRTYKTLCAHHILPFFGQFIIGYIPERMIIGASKIPRIVEMHMRRLQSQEHRARRRGYGRKNPRAARSGRVDGRRAPLHGDARGGAGVVVHGDQRPSRRVPQRRQDAPGIHVDRESAGRTVITLTH